MAINARGEDLKALLDMRPDGPVVMLNLLRFRAGGRESYLEYLRLMTEHSLPRYGGEVVYAGDASNVLIAEPGQAWDFVVMVRYPSREAFSRMVRDPEYQQVTTIRTAALEEAVLQATIELTRPF